MSASLDLLICDSHPVQYKAPVYRELAKTLGAGLRVFYATDCSVRGHEDAGFGKKITWDVPLLTGYAYEVLNCERGKPLTGFFTLGTWSMLSRVYEARPTTVLLSQSIYLWDMQILLSCALLGIPVYLRVETQDEAQSRAPRKEQLRGYVWWLVYRFFTGAFYIGKLNREHLLRHGFRAAALRRSPYCVDSEVMRVSDGEAVLARVKLRAALGLVETDICVGFFGKLIPKKNPELILEMGSRLNAVEKQRTVFLFVGSGEREETLRLKASDAGLRVIFAGFVNQGDIASYYFATDIAMLPSRRMGETWGLVVNEALAGGCGVIVTDAVGSHVEFSHLRQVRVIKDNDATGAVQAWRDLVALGRPSRGATSDYLNRFYSVRTAATGILEGVKFTQSPIV